MAISLINLATCQYKNEGYDCDELARDTDNRFCIFHDTNYLKDDNYEKHKEEVVMRFQKKLSEYSSKRMPFKFIGYCLPDILCELGKFTEALYFSRATFYGKAMFEGSTFTDIAEFTGATFADEANFDAKFLLGANFPICTFLSRAYFSGYNLLRLHNI